MEIRCHLDGARLWNACAATGIQPAEYAKHFDTISCCFSKGLGAPVGSAVCGDAKTITRVARFRKMFGGAMRQSGVLAAAALYALDNHRTRLTQDHEGAKRLARGLSELPRLSVAADEVDTNMVFFDVAPSFMSAADFCKKLDDSGVRMLPTGLQRVRAVVHLDVAPEMIGQAVETIRAAVR
jgi:threonine aldolase